MKLAEILTGPETWAQRRFGHADTRKCLVGALISLYPGDDDAVYRRERARLDRAILEIDPSNTDHALMWNDAVGRTWDEVATVVDAYDRDRLLNP